MFGVPGGGGGCGLILRGGVKVEASSLRVQLRKKFRQRDVIRSQGIRDDMGSRS